MRFRSVLFAASVGALLASSGACRRAPAEQVTSHDAEATRSPASDLDAGDASRSTGRGIDGGRADIRNFCGDIYAADDARLIQRCGPKDIALAQGLARAASKVCADDVNLVVDRARTSFDADAAKQCVQMLQDSPMPRTNDFDTLFSHFPCDSVILGMQGEGQACRFSVECKFGLACEGYTPSGDGTCQKPPKTGQPCIGQRFGTLLNETAAQMHHPACVSGAWCDGKACQPLIAQGKDCVSPLSCAGGLWCVMGKCDKLGGSGAACLASTDCASDLWCDKARDAGAGKCATKRPAGAECPTPDACKGRCDSVTSIDAGAPRVGHCIDVCNSG